MNLKRLLCAVLLAPMILLAIPGAASAGPRHDDQITRLYRTVLGRDPDPLGHAYWTERRESGESLRHLARVMLTTPEVGERSSGDLIVDVYRNALGREPDPQGYEFWSKQNPWDMIAMISDSPEHIEVTGTLQPPYRVVEEQPAPSHPAGWVDAGHGVYVPPILLEIRWCESRDDYTAANRWSSARGAYQFLSSSWAAYGHADRYGVRSADKATPAQQDEAAVLTWQRDGTRPWNASGHCW